ncbi:hypothetical protein HS960_04760 [Sphingobacterium paramultivorum]|uniref:Peptidase C39-like domain-containing protein n=1 Tax=Sphingobacterium paramultivorum TaxID=2886510 RepID=A0A7G5DZ29_9SPHI|nr:MULTISPECIES: hypothetical protein [Sphingobacterium]QMV67004.1 hypothetical protein HS960_04760 [Sphingobacterium paramultivorum]WSO15846.1 hypothetical protein VUL84_04735 [Sphingobacterium paramultivorum]
MKKMLFILVLLISTAVIFHAKAQVKNNNNYDFFDTVVNNHNQIFPASGIPSAIEMVLKYCKVVDFNFYDLQIKWQNKTDGSFRDFDKKELYGITFSQKFNLPRDESFPMDSLFQAIENELKSGKKVIIALQVETGWSIFVVYKQTPDGEFVSYSKHGSHTTIFRNTKEIVKKSNGTEIMTYSIVPHL